MQQNYQTTKAPTVATISPSRDGANWSNKDNILVNDSNSASLFYFQGGDFGADISGSAFGFNLPPGAIIDGISVYIDGTQNGCYGSVSIGIGDAKDMGSLAGVYGSSNDLWGLDEITPAQLAGIIISVGTGDISGGDGSASIQYETMTVYWHIEPKAAPADVPTRVAYKVYSRDGNFLGELPNVTSRLAFSQDINSAGSSLAITCGSYVKNETTVEPLLDNTGAPIQTQSGQNILATSTDVIVAQGNSDDEALFKNSNRIKVYLYNYWHPNGKLMFSGQINRVSMQFGGGDSSVQLMAYSDGLDLDNYIARGYPFTYTTDVSQTSQNGSAASVVNAKAGWDVWGQTFKTGPAVTNLGAITLMLQGVANVTVIVYDRPDGAEIARISQPVNVSVATAIQFEFAQLVPVASATTYFFAVWVDQGQSINVFRNTANVYADGSRYRSQYAGGSGGGAFTSDTADLYFVTKYGTPTTTTTYSSDDPVTEMARGILLDYNARGGYITERDFEATGLSLTYTFNTATIFDAIKKVIELSPTGYYSYIDLGTAEMDIKQISSGADFTIVRGKDINQLNLSLSIEQVKNYLLLSGGEVTPGVNLFRQYQDIESTSNYGIRMATRSDNRLTLNATANAIGGTFIEENADEAQETSATVSNDQIDITLLTPGKTIGFRNFGSFIDNIVVQIVRRDFNPDAVALTLGRLPITMNAEVQRINRDLMLQQTVNNPAQPS